MCGGWFQHIIIILFCFTSIEYINSSCKFRSVIPRLRSLWNFWMSHWPLSRLAALSIHNLRIWIGWPYLKVWRAHFILQLLFGTCGKFWICRKIYYLFFIYSYILFKIPETLFFFKSSLTWLRIEFIFVELLFSSSKHFM